MEGCRGICRVYKVSQHKRIRKKRGSLRITNDATTKEQLLKGEKHKRGAISFLSLVGGRVLKGHEKKGGRKISCKLSEREKEQSPGKWNLHCITDNE